MTRLPSISSSYLIRKLKKAGFVFKRQGKGSHEFWINPETKRVVMVSRHSSSTIPKGTLKAIIENMGISVGDFVEL
ncbi:MAG: addiction module toxin, HicA family [Candidatus Altiarchaeales archaeon IMC4]|nr:MAG: addiction module toxin, HicA family [Candidatus Altiarchaeales archaeon IMC4]